MDTKKIWTKDEIRKNLETSQAWVERGILAIYQEGKGQTLPADEASRGSGQTVKPDMGFPKGEAAGLALFFRRR